MAKLDRFERELSCDHHLRVCFPLLLTPPASSVGTFDLTIVMLMSIASSCFTVNILKLFALRERRYPITQRIAINNVPAPDGGAFVRKPPPDLFSPPAKDRNLRCRHL